MRSEDRSSSEWDQGTDLPGVEAPQERTRRGFLRSSAAAAGLVLSSAAVTQAGPPTGRQGVSASARKRTTTPAATFPNLYPNSNATQFAQIRTDENAHVQFLVSALGSNARPAPTFQNLLMPDIFTFARTSFLLENTGVDAYLGAAPAINNKAYLAAAGSILTVEARHAGYLGVLLDATMDLFNQSRDNPYIPLPFLLTNVTPFLASLNGGPALTFDANNPSDTNDIAILNVALALEYLEAEFYNINVPRFFGV